MKKKVFLFILIIVFVYAFGGICYNLLFREDKTIKKLDSIDKYGYVLNSNSTDVIKDEFNNLKNILNSDVIDYQEYAKSISKLFILELYTIDNKLNKYDVGGANYVFSSAVSNFKINVQDTLYKYLEDNSDGKRNQVLPIVASIEIKDISDTTYKIGENEYDGYKLSLKWSYVEDLGYDNDGTIIVIKDNNKLYIAEKE